MDGEEYDRLLASVTILTEVVIELIKEAPEERRSSISRLLSDIERNAADSIYGDSIREMVIRLQPRT